MSLDYDCSIEIIASTFIIYKMGFIYDIVNSWGNNFNECNSNLIRWMSSKAFIHFLLHFRIYFNHFFVIKNIWCEQES